MPGYPATRSFTNNVSNNRNPLSGNDYTNKKRAETIYENLSLNAKITNIQEKKNGSKYNGPVYIDTNRCLDSIGGFDINTYKLYLDVTKGKYFLHKKCNENNIHMDISNIDLVYKISEGPFYIANKDNSNNSICEQGLKDHYDLSYINQFPTYDLTNFYFPRKISLVKSTHT